MLAAPSFFFRRWTKKVGRYWGVVGKKNIPWGRAESFVLNQAQSKFVLRTVRRYMRSVNRHTRIRRVAKEIRLKPSELISFGGWFNREPWQGHLGKRLRACDRRMPQNYG